MAEALQKSDLEVLVATMNRNSLDFLKPMFPFEDFYNFSILVINQTTPGSLLDSPYPAVRVINSFETGLSKSRNLALHHAKGKLVLISDDDVQYVEGFDNAIIQFYNNTPAADVAFFKTITTEGKPYSKYKNDVRRITDNKALVPVLSVELTFKLKAIQNKGIIFNELFGLGARFQDAETLYFLRRALANGLRLFFCPVYIVKHKAFSSSDDVVSDRVLYAKAAGYYKRFGNRSYFYVLKYLIFLLRKRMMPISMAAAKFKVGLKGINDYKECLRNNTDTLYD